ncbi:MAG: ATP-binding cassette domain-containing protein [Solirubrobacteraceae bacterium]
MSAAETVPAIELSGLGRRYGERTALRDLSLKLPAGATLAVLGANGAGKTTLLRILAGLLRPHDGRARVLGLDLPREAPLLRGRVGLLGNEPLLYRDLSARENLRFHAGLHRVDPAQAEALLGQVGMDTRADEPLRALSRGMVQRVAVCRAVLHDPELLLLDEPLAHLDPAAADAAEPLIGPGSARRVDSAPRTRVAVSHDPGAAIADAQLVLGLRAGVRMLLGPADAISAEQIEGLYR